jgi:hypothetical protein
VRIGTPGASQPTELRLLVGNLAGAAMTSSSDESFKSVAELIAHIDAFIASYNQNARPFVWTKSKVHQKRLKQCFADQ